jgi:hypothetical protein
MTLIFYLPNSIKRKEAIDYIIGEFSNTKSSVMRKSFIEFCVSAAKVCSAQFIKTYLMKDIFSLAIDVSPPVRIKFL